MSVDTSTLRFNPYLTSVLYSPEWWVLKLEESLFAKRNRLDLLSCYDSGDAPLVDIAETVRTAYKDFQRRARTNFAGLCVDTMLDRVQITGIRTGATGDDLGDSLAWDMWQSNSLDADSNSLHRASFALGEAMAIVGDIDAETGFPLVTIEDPRNIAIARDPLRRRSIRAALKIFTDEWTGQDHAYLYLRGELGMNSTVYRAERSTSRTAGGWSWVSGPEFLPFSKVPVVWFPNQLDIDGKTYWGEFEKHTDVLDRINTTILQRVVTAAMQAFRQRVITGLPIEDQDGEPIDYDQAFAADPAALWQLPEGATIWESLLTDLSPMLMAARDDIKDFAAVTRTPLSSLSPDAANQSAKGTDLAENGLIFKVIDRANSLSESWEQVFQLMFLWMDDAVRAKRSDMEMLWMSPSIPSMSERFDAAAKAKAAGVPEQKILLDIVGMTPQELRRYASQLAAQTLSTNQP